MPDDLRQFRNNVHSQNGEDGIIAEIVKRLDLAPDGERWCVEFGAWDGKHLSNTFALVSQGWNAVYIEGDAEKYKDLLNTVEKYKKIRPICAMVSADSESNQSLDQLLQSTDIPSEYDILSIDIDSYDLDVWEAHGSSPKIVIIEINSSALPGVVWRHGAKTPGNTFTATLNVARRKGYSLVCHTGNMIFVRDDLVHMLGLPARVFLYPEVLFDDRWVPELASASSTRCCLLATLKRLLPASLKVRLKQAVGSRT